MGSHIFPIGSQEKDLWGGGGGHHGRREHGFRDGVLGGSKEFDSRQTNRSERKDTELIHRRKE